MTHFSFPPSIDSLHQAFRKKQWVDVDPHQLVTLGYTSYFIRYLTTCNYETQRISHIATALFKHLENKINQISPSDCENDLTMQTCRLFLKNLRYQSLNQPVDALIRRFVAIKLALPESAIQETTNPGFLSFAIKSHIDRYLLHFHQQLQADKQTGEILLPFKDCMISWSQAKDIINQPCPKISPKLPDQHWYIGRSGLQNKNMYEWNTLKPYKIENDPSWGNRYLVEFCTICSDTPLCSNIPQLSGDHSWIRLKTPKGEIYSIGLYRPDKKHWWNHFIIPLTIKPGYLMQPDVSEFWPGKIYPLSFEINEKQFLQLKSEIEQSKNIEQIFHVFKKNCVVFCKEIGEKVGIHFNTSTHILRLLTPLSLQKIYDHMCSKLPSLVERICIATVTPFLILLLTLLGGTRVSYKPNIKPFLKFPQDLFNTKKLYIHPPNVLGLKRYTELKTWISEDNENRVYQIPKWMRL